MICPECSREISELARSVMLGDSRWDGTLELAILVCHKCNWVSVHDLTLIRQYPMNLENKEEVK